MASGLPPPARIPSSEAIRKAALARSAKRGARVAAWRLGFRWLTWGFGHFLVGLGALTVVAALFMGLRWGWTAAQARWTAPQHDAQTNVPASTPGPRHTAAAPTLETAAAPSAAQPASAPAATPTSRRGFPLRLDDSDPSAAPKRAATGAQSPAPRNTENQRP